MCIRDRIKAIQKAVNELYSAGVKRNPCSSLIKGIKDLFKSGEDDGDKSTEAKLAKIGEAAAESANRIFSHGVFQPGTNYLYISH